jgi:RNA polymerase primary sigma factor
VDRQARVRQANLRLVVTIARRFNHGRMPLQDLIQEGNIGLMKAVDRFDHRKGFRFSTYGSWWIRHAITRAIADKARAVRLPVHMIDAYNKVSRARREFEAVPRPPPHRGRARRRHRRQPERLQRMRVLADREPRQPRPAALRRLGPHPPRRHRGHQHPAEPAEAMDNDLLMDNLREVFETLSPMEADILRKRMGLDDEQEMTLKEIGATTRSRASASASSRSRPSPSSAAEFERRGLL